MRALLAGARGKLPALLDLTTRLVQVESPSDSKPAVDACMDLAATHAESLQARIKRHRQRHYGDVLELRFGPHVRAGAKTPANRILLLGHLDTVWPIGTLKTMPCRIRPDAEGHSRLYGPGSTPKSSSCSTAKKRSAVPFRGPSPKSSPGSAPPSTSSSRPRAWP
jgi:glutamate carboxypeptidase